MSASVHYKFRSAKHFGRVQFEGDFIQLAELKVAIVEQEKLQFGEDFDLQVVDAQTQEEYHDEEMLIPKNTSVIVKRIPAGQKQGILSQIALAKKNERFAEILDRSTSGTGVTAGVIAAAARQFLAGKLGPVSGINPSAASNEPVRLRSGDEETRLASVIQAAGAGDSSANQRGSQRPGGRPTGPMAADGPPAGAQPPPGYICHRCGEPGHYIQHCTASLDGDVNVIRVKRPTGIPRSMLKTIDAPLDGGTELQLPGGKFVTLATDDREFAKEPLAVRMARLAEARAALEEGAKDPEAMSGVAPAAAELNHSVSEDKNESEIIRNQGDFSETQARFTERESSAYHVSDRMEDSLSLPADIRHDLPYFPLPKLSQKELFFGEAEPPAAREFQEVVWGIILMNRTHALGDGQSPVTEARASAGQTPPAVVTEPRGYVTAHGRAPNRPPDGPEIAQDVDESRDAGVQRARTKQRASASTSQPRQRGESKMDPPRLLERTGPGHMVRKHFPSPADRQMSPSGPQSRGSVPQLLSSISKKDQTSMNRNRLHPSNPSQYQGKHFLGENGDKAPVREPVATEGAALPQPRVATPHQKETFSSGSSSRAIPDEEATEHASKSLSRPGLDGSKELKRPQGNTLTSSRGKTPSALGSGDAPSYQRERQKPESRSTLSSEVGQRRGQPSLQVDAKSVQRGATARTRPLSGSQRLKQDSSFTPSGPTRDDSRKSLYAAYSRDAGDANAPDRNSLGNATQTKMNTKVRESCKTAASDGSIRPTGQQRVTEHHHAGARTATSVPVSNERPCGSQHQENSAQKVQTIPVIQRLSRSEPGVATSLEQASPQHFRTQATTGAPNRSKIPVFARLGPKVETNEAEQAEKRVASSLASSASLSEASRGSVPATPRSSLRARNNKPATSLVSEKPGRLQLGAPGEASAPSLKRPAPSTDVTGVKRQRDTASPHEKATASVFERLGPALPVPTHLAKRISTGNAANSGGHAGKAVLPREPVGVASKSTNGGTSEGRRSSLSPARAGTPSSQPGIERMRQNQSALPW
ncbi:E3 ubiquitin-protein ligase rbbp6 [Cyanidiococcus yangmingshanensis]|uniref:E3 ubiquitin-protein ligase rbbp6 n=1 Tax=Cyanidiococcus yangmingshanensis TaxID=2690220 RepID=A0A7J7INN9_9RHOD|nr:E3 ubiquitin-protein ligase rbbp6 [Cyanidiococcus yangmingshanensis]